MQSILYIVLHYVGFVTSSLVHIFSFSLFVKLVRDCIFFQFGWYLVRIFASNIIYKRLPHLRWRTMTMTTRTYLVEIYLILGIEFRTVENVVHIDGIIASTHTDVQQHQHAPLHRSRYTSLELIKRDSYGLR